MGGPEGGGILIEIRTAILNPGRIVCRTFIITGITVVIQMGIPS